MQRAPTRALNRRPFFATGLWLALLTAALNSLLPIGLPRSTAIGSAFSPATTIEALRAGSPSVRQINRRRLTADRVPTFWRRARARAEWHLATLALVPGAALIPANATRAFAPRTAHTTAFPPAHGYSARGPPLA